MVDDEGSALAVIDGLVAVEVQVETEFCQRGGNDEILVFEVWVNGLEGGEVLHGGVQQMELPQVDQPGQRSEVADDRVIQHENL